MFEGCPYNESMLEKLKDWVEPGSEEEQLLSQVDFSRVPVHVAVIMDGNGRWARQKNLPRAEGHRAGAKSVQEVVEACGRLGVKYLTLYAFSKENWKRPAREIATLWKLLYNYLRKEDKILVKNKFRLVVIGQKEAVPDGVRKELERVEELTKGFSALTILLALNYSGRAEIVDAVKKILRDRDVDAGNLTEEKFAEHLYTARFPDPDLLIRTSGELRISNFLLWQVAYSEIWITPEYWPDFRKKHFLQSIIDFQKRERRFGDIHGLKNDV